MKALSHENLVAEVTRVLKMEADAVLKCAERMSQENNAKSFTRAISYFTEALDAGGKIVVSGIGKSGKIGQKIAATLSSTGSPAVFLHPTEGLHGDLGIVSSRDVVLAMSYTGNTEELIRLMPALRSLRVPIVGLGGNAQSQLAQQCDAWIDGYVEIEACPHNLAPTTSTTLALALGDAIAVALMQMRGFDARSFAQNHPGGSLGKRLNLLVRDVMHQGDAVATVTSSASMDEVVGTSTRKKLGAVLVVDGEKLLGVITDGDIRRALQHREKFFNMKASEVMTSNPITVTADLKAQEALTIMENRPSQISVLPVIDAQNRWIGILRLHDLVRTF